MSQPIEFFYDFRSPYSYLAFTQITGSDLTLRPINVLKVMEKVGNVPTTITCAAKGRYARTDLARWAKRYGVTINSSNMRDNDSNACARAVLAAHTAADAAAITLALFQACWSNGKSLATTDDILQAIAAADIDSAPIAARIDAPELAGQLESNIKEAAERGVFGAPTMFVGEAMFFGNDRLDFVREELANLEKAS